MRSRSWWALVWAGIGAFGALGACGGNASGGTDSESHFACKDDDECEARFGAGYACVAGECRAEITRARDGGTCVEGEPCSGPGGCSGRTVCADGGEAEACDCERFGAPALEPDAAQGSPSCSSQRFAAERIQGAVYLLLDATSAMNEPVPEASTTWWEETVAGIEHFLMRDEAVGLSVGVQFFPLEDGAGTACTADYGAPAVDLVRIPEGTGALEAALAARVPLGPASIGPAVSGTLDWASAGASATPLVVLLTRQYPAECSPASVEELALRAALATEAPVSVRTGVIGLGSGLEDWNAVASAGGTAEGIYVESGDVAVQVSDAIRELLVGRAPESCVFELPRPPDGEVVSPNTVEVFLEMTPGSDELLYNVPLPGDCELEPEGFYFDDLQSPTLIHLCPLACERASTSTVVISIGCAYDEERPQGS